MPPAARLGPATLLGGGGATLPALPRCLEDPSGHYGCVSILDHDPIGWVVGLQPCPMHSLALRGSFLSDLVEPAIGAPVPDHVAGVDGVDEDGANGRIGPLATIYTGPGRTPGRGHFAAVERFRDGLKPPSLIHIETEDVF